MGWFKVDDQLAFHAKSVMAGNSAMGLWVRAGSWSSAQLTDGFIPTHMANAMANPMAKPCDPDALVMAGLWNEAEGGFQFHEWQDFQPSAEVEKAKRKATSAARSRAGKAGAAARWNDKPDSKGMANEWQSDGPDPTRPDPINALSKESAGDGPRKKPAVRLPASWEPNDAHTKYANDEGIALDFQAERFRTHAEANDRRMVSWDAAFRNWLLKAERTKKVRPNASSPWNKEFFK